ncbi:nuclear receptor subfamily 2 group E member 1 isoform X2 [Odontomachus brunneus]|uniref:nuclear receptor subfamily 2 group E member 1 isoform X2 n=1 Tax=Odontomachus brunneus TaxID=486640 RepID=UPI0013F1A6A7|nr:nuclear receptor subfamily 2 group E member 1 isoform X2 [Odontomachus brunneus]XP_032687192.1 nuclear receptor subfamily 2 group E member 1 isoform X2 [Odontomachus brunneus]
MQNQESQLSHVPPPKMPASSSRILYDIPCKVCRDHSSGKHYGIFACDGCAGFFKRSIRRNRQYVCKAKSEGGCMVDKTHRNQCRACRLAKCIQAGMNKDAVQHERGPRNSTIRRQMALYYKEPEIIANMAPPTVTALDLALPKPSAESRVSVAAPPTHPPLPHPIYCNALAMSKFPINMANFSTISLMPPITSESICEQAARILFFNVHWTRDLVTGTNLTLEDQLTLLESSWRELFLLAAAQLMPTLDPTPLLPPTPHGIELAVEVNRFRETLAGFHGMNLDFQEFSYIRAIVHFKAGLDCEPVSGSRNSSGTSSPSVANRLRNPTAVARLRDSAQLALGQRLSGASYGALRFGKNKDRRREERKERGKRERGRFKA